MPQIRIHFETTELYELGNIFAPDVIEKKSPWGGYLRSYELNGKEGMDSMLAELRKTQWRLIRALAPQMTPQSPTLNFTLQPMHDPLEGIHKENLSAFKVRVDNPRATELSHAIDVVVLGMNWTRHDHLPHGPQRYLNKHYRPPLLMCAPHSLLPYIWISRSTPSASTAYRSSAPSLDRRLRACTLHQITTARARRVSDEVFKFSKHLDRLGSTESWCCVCVGGRGPAPKWGASSSVWLIRRRGAVCGRRLARGLPCCVDFSRARQERVDPAVVTGWCAEWSSNRRGVLAEVSE
ncbi:hypothetical protein B0H11DRAFT_1910461 [Mycena galericulata]|nr:hypothetical protein B0H11DRAFT_1910461 [Mycena galericulata]